MADLHDLQHDPELAKALGNMVVAWAYAETILTGTLARVCGIDINMAIFGYYRIPTFEARTKYLLALIQEWHPEKFDREAIIKEIEGISGQSTARNHWVHGLWYLDKTKNETIIFDMRKAEDSRRKPVKAADVQNHINALNTRSARLAVLIDYPALTDVNRPRPSH